MSKKEEEKRKGREKKRVKRKRKEGRNSDTVKAMTQSDDVFLSFCIFAHCLPTIEFIIM